MAPTIEQSANIVTSTHHLLLQGSRKAAKFRAQREVKQAVDLRSAAPTNQNLGERRSECASFAFASFPFLNNSPSYKRATSGALGRTTVSSESPMRALQDVRLALAKMMESLLTKGSPISFPSRRVLSSVPSCRPQRLHRVGGSPMESQWLGKLRRERGRHESSIDFSVL